MGNDIDKALKQRLETAWDVPPMQQGNRERFIAGLERMQRPRRNRRRMYIGMFSAMAAAVMGFVLLLVRPRTDVGSAPEPMELTISEVKGYYKAKLWSESEYIVRLADRMDEDTRESLLRELKKMEQEPDSLVERIMAEPISDDLKVYYITQMYTYHLRSMQNIHSLLDESMAQK